jgi:hypothetical protein
VFRDCCGTRRRNRTRRTAGVWLRRRERVASRAHRDRPFLHQHPLDDATAVRFADIFGPGRKEHVEDFDEAATLQPVQQLQVERPPAFDPRTRGPCCPWTTAETSPRATRGLI